MKGKQLRNAVLLGMAMSMAVWTTGFATDHIYNDGANGTIESIENLDPEDDNIIVGTENGVLSNDIDTITIAAGNNNYIGQNPGEEEQTITSQTGINSIQGSVNVIAGNENNIIANKDGVIANGDTRVSLSGFSNSIDVSNVSGEAIQGIAAEHNGVVNISSTGSDFIVTAKTTGTYAYGIAAGTADYDGSGTININAVGDIQIDVATGAPDAKDGNVYGIYSQGDSNVILDSGKNIIISTKSQVVQQSVGGHDTAGVVAQNGGNMMMTTDGFLELETRDWASSNYGISANAIDSLLKTSSVKIITDGKNEDGYGVAVSSNGKLSYGIFSQNGTNDITANGGGISINAEGIETTYGVYVGAVKVDSYINLTAHGDISLNAHNTGNSFVTGITTYSGGVAAETSISGQDINIEADSESNAAYAVWGSANGVGASSYTHISGDNVTITSNGNTAAYGLLATNSDMDIDAKGTTSINSNGYGICAQNNSAIALTSEGGINQIRNNGNYGIYSDNNSQISLTAANGNTISSNSYGLLTYDSHVNLTADKGINEISAGQYGIYTMGYFNTYDSNVLELKAERNIVAATKENGIGIFASKNGEDINLSSEVNLTASNGDNIVQAGTIDDQGFGSGVAVKALSGAQLTFKAENGWNAHLGAIDTRNDGTNVTLDGVVNAVYSAAKIDKAGNLDDDDKFKDKTVISALYAEGDAAITATGDWNIFRTTADPNNENQLERVLWAYDGADITVDGGVYISTDNYSISPNSADIAVAAGTATDLTYEKVTTAVADEDRAHVNLTYGAGSSITGDILAAYAGTVNIDAKEGSDAGISVTGNILAGNNGVLNLDLGKGGVLTGRADDYGDAGLNTTGEDNIDQGHATHEFFNPAFSSTIFKGGEVNLTMGEGSRWNVTGQSWVTRINTESAALADDVLAAENPVEAMNHMATIDLVEANTDRNTNAHALIVYEMTGDAVFNMSLDADRDVSDMLYMKSANGDYIINVVDAVTLDDMYAEGFDGLRFATVGEGSNVSFRAVTVGQGVFNVEYEVGTDAYANNDENHAYNGGESVSQDKPGSDLVDGLFESTQEPGVAETQAAGKRMRMAAMATPAAANDGIMLLDDTAAANDTVASDGSVDETTNFKLIGRKDESTSNAGKTIVAMSKVNYSNAVYMDRLNKRMGEARYIDGDEGLWVRMRHDRIGKSNAFRSKNTMFELGYDRKVGDREDGEHRQGVVFDYMRGTADYHNVAGEGDVRRGGVWFYDTWLGNKGHYTDYVLKFGRLSNDFDIYSELGEKITGDYSNFVYSASAEYGRKKSLGGDWYIEPQAQLQYAHVTDADYTTSQGTSVQLDAIDSLIGRVGFRHGKDVSDTSTFYIKADVLHEFLGDQDISAFDDTGRLDTTYENEGTWYDVGLGFSHQFSKGTYMFLDVEKTFGNDNEDTYQFNVGMNWKV